MTISPGAECKGWWYGCEVDGPCVEGLGARSQVKRGRIRPGITHQVSC